MRRFGLIGYPLGHSFSKKYFTEKFEKQAIDAEYELYPLDDISELAALIKSDKKLVGLNVTIPYKELVINYLDELDDTAKRIGAVNTILVKSGKLKGYNTDYIGFKNSLIKFIGANSKPERALILGTGGASKAVSAVLDDLSIQYRFVSRNPTMNELSYQALNDRPIDYLKEARLVINTTPLGTAPNIEALPNLPYHLITKDHFLFDLVYNPLETAFIKKGIEAKCWVKNGLEMLHGQADAAWQIWNT
jgi:shikimate dehydrogenase